MFSEHATRSLTVNNKVLVTLPSQRTSEKNSGISTLVIHHVNKAAGEEEETK